MLVFFSVMLILPVLACGPGGLDLPEVNVPEGAAATAEGMARDAATAVARVTVPPGAQETVAAAGQSAATAVAIAGEEGGEAVSTLQASNFSINVTVNTEQLREKIASAQPDENGQINITVTDDEINQAIELREGADSAEAATFQNPAVAFTGGNVLLTGDVTRPIPAELIASFEPLIVDGQAQVDLQSVTLRGLPIPPQALGSVEQSLNSALREMTSSLPAGYIVQEIDMGEGTMTIIAGRV
jgi:hypothetical protein